MSLGLVLSGGGVRGSTHIGVLKALYEEGIQPRMISGTSSGSIVAGLYAYGYSPDEIALIAQNMSRRFIDVDYYGIINSVFSFFINGHVSISGIIKGDYLERNLEKLTKGALLKQVRMPLAITAVDINNSNIIVFTSYPSRILLRQDYVYLHDFQISEAIRASISIPGIFKPKIVNGMRLVDGGVRANLPVEIVRNMGAHKVIAVNLGYTGYPVPEVDNIVEISLQTLDLMIYQITQPSIESADIIITPTLGNVKHNDMSKIDQLIKSGYESTKRAIPAIKKMLMI